MGLIIMKKDYISPEVNVTYVEAYNMIAASVTDVAGDSGIEMGEGEAPDVADAKQNLNAVQWESWEDVEDQEKQQ